VHQGSKKLFTSIFFHRGSNGRRFFLLQDCRGLDLLDKRARENRRRLEIVQIFDSFCFPDQSVWKKVGNENGSFCLILLELVGEK
jgi:hypothetical protein